MHSGASTATKAVDKREGGSSDVLPDHASTAPTAASAPTQELAQFVSEASSGKDAYNISRVQPQVQQGRWVAEPEASVFVG